MTTTYFLSNWVSIWVMSALTALLGVRDESIIWSISFWCSTYHSSRSEVVILAWGFLSRHFRIVSCSICICSPMSFYFSVPWATLAACSFCFAFRICNVICSGEASRPAHAALSTTARCWNLESRPKMLDEMWRISGIVKRSSHAMAILILFWKSSAVINERNNHHASGGIDSARSFT